MARPVKVSLDYFPFDCYLDDKFKLLEAQYGLKGFAIVVKLLQKTYGGFGYYCEWSEDISLLFKSEINLDLDSSLVSDTIEAALKRGIFSREMYDKYQILTSAGIQKRYVEASKRRVEILIDERYLLLNSPKNQVNVAKTMVNDTETRVNEYSNTQSKVNKSKVNHINAYANRFNNFNQRTPDDDDLEDKLLSNKN